ncbi:portal protein [Microvirga aerophila]|uniref:Portal protein n=1 Tax=Microvirga aerophila TaxID=670291 RepID=A0A512C021_9HYPH|nr:portal protein [Microvirga aerophila]
MLALLARPNAREGGQRFLESLYGHLLVSGNAYVEAVQVDGAPRELHALRPDRMRVVPGADGWPTAYDYTVGAETIRFAQRDGDSIAPILHLTLFHPADDHYGLSPMEAAATALDIHNAAGAWNKALLDNAARPSGALVVGGTALTDAQFDRLKGELEINYQGAANAGRPLLLEGGLDWKPLSLSPKDMDFVEAKAAAARDIALAFGVPPLLLGLPGDNTHANYAEANRAFYRQTVIPLVKRTAEALAHWLSPSFSDALRLEPDLDAVEALGTERESLWRRVSAASFLTDEEKREAVGYGRRQ